jgi:hypothetical protein
MGGLICEKHGPQGWFDMSSDLVDPASGRPVARGVVVEFHYKNLSYGRMETSEAFAAQMGWPLDGSTIEVCDTSARLPEGVRRVCSQCYVESMSLVESPLQTSFSLKTALNICKCQSHGLQLLQPISPDLIDPNSRRVIGRGLSITCRIRGRRAIKMALSEAFLARNDISLVGSVASYAESPPSWINEMAVVCRQCYVDAVAQMEA